MRIIDAHVHLYPEGVNRDPAGWARAHGEPDWAGLCTRRRRSGCAVQGFPSVDELLNEMDRAGVERAVLLGWYWRRRETCAWQNRFYASCVREHPDRFSACATVEPAAGAAAVRAELQRAADDGLVGLGELSPHAQAHALDEANAPELADRETAALPQTPAHTLDDDGLAAALAFAAERRWPVTLHVTDPNSREYPGRVETPLEDFVALAHAHPGVNFVLAHWGGLLPLRNAAVAKLPNLYYDTAASPLLYDDTIWRRFLAVVPAEHVLFGSDYPLNVYPKLDGVPTMTRLVAEATAAGMPAAVAHANAARLFRP